MRDFSMDKYTKIKARAKCDPLPTGGCREGFSKAAKLTPATTQPTAPLPRGELYLRKQKKAPFGRFYISGYIVLGCCTFGF